MTQRELAAISIAHQRVVHQRGDVPHARDIREYLANAGIAVTTEDVVEACRGLGLALRDMPGEPTDVTREMPAVKP